MHFCVSLIANILRHVMLYNSVFLVALKQLSDVLDNTCQAMNAMPLEDAPSVTCTF
jgi:hypothetical protein